MQLDMLYREIEALGGAPIMDDYDEGYTDGLNDALAVLRKFGFGLDMAPSSEWRPIKSAPHGQCIVWEPMYGWLLASKDTLSDAWMLKLSGNFWVECPREVSFTHWIPLPSPPTNEEPHAPTNPN
jgi:hypothetical protein